VTEEFSPAYAAAYDLLNEGKPYDEEVAFVLRIFEKFSQGNTQLESILDLGCGSGRHLERFDPQIQKAGIDRSPGMLSEAREKKMQNADFVESDICSARLDRTFGLVYSLFHVLSYQVTDSALVDFFSSIAHHLHDDGVGVVDFWHRAPWDHDPPVTRLTRRTSANLDVVRISRPSFSLVTGYVDIEMTVFVSGNDAASGYQMFEEKHTMRSYTLSELSYAATLGGLDVVGSGPWMIADRELGSSDWYGWLALRKRSLT
jgi:SAM-dependent methyltransferase